MFRRRHLAEQLARLAEQVERLTDHELVPPGRRLVRLHLKDDARSVEGILYHVDRGHYYLSHAQVLIGTGREPTGLDGQTWWPRGDVFHVQELEPR